MSNNDHSPLTRSVPLWWDTSPSPRFLRISSMRAEALFVHQPPFGLSLTSPTSREAMCSPWSSYIIVFHILQWSKSTHGLCDRISPEITEVLSNTIHVLWALFVQPQSLGPRLQHARGLYPITRRRPVLFTWSPLQFQMVIMKYEGFEGEN